LSLDANILKKHNVCPLRAVDGDSMFLKMLASAEESTQCRNPEEYYHGHFLFKRHSLYILFFLYFCRSLPEIDGLSKETVLTSWMAKFDCIFKGIH
jgi:hypothetical protein